MKKHLSLIAAVLSLFMVISVIAPVSSFASDNEYDDFALRRGLLRAIGIDIDENAISVSRSEFVSYIAKAFSLSEIEFKGSIPYTDVSAKDSFYNAVGVLYDLGVLSANDKFNPNLNISSEEASKIVISALGYDYIAQAKGGYPTGYLALASSMDINIASNDTINGKKIVDILYETLMAKPNYEAMADRLPYADGKNGFEVYHNITEIEGVVTSNNITSIYSYVDVTEGNAITLDGMPYDVDYTLTDGERTISACLGAHISAFVYDYDGRDEKIIFFDSSDNDFVNIQGADSDKNGFKITVADDTKEKTYTLSAGFSVILNGMLCDDFTDSDFENKDGKILLTDNNGDRKYDVVNIENSEYIIVDSFNYDGGYISDKNKHGYGVNDIKVIDLTKNDTAYEFFMVVDGKVVPCTMEDLESFKSFSLVMSRNGDYIKLTGFSNVVSGEVTETSDDEIMIENISYKETAYSNEHNVYIPFGSYLSAYLTPDGKIIYLESDENNLSYGYLMKIGHEGGLGGYCAAILLGSGVKQTVNFGSKLTLDGVNVSTDFGNTSSVAYTKLFDKPQLIKYSVNKDGEFAVIDTYEETTDYEALNSYYAAKDPKNSLMKYTDINDLDRRTASYTTIFSPYLVPRSVRIFAVPEILSTVNAHTYNFSMDDFEVITIEDFPVSDSIADVYDITRNRDAGAIVLYTDVAGDTLPGLGSRSTNAVIDRITDSVNEDGEQVKKVTYTIVKDGESEAVFVTGLFSSALQKEYERRGYNFKPGDYVYVAHSGEEITNMFPLVYYDSWTVNPDAGLKVKCSDYYSLDFCAKGILVDFSDSVISVLLDDDDPNDGYDNRRIVAFPTSGTQYLVRFNPLMNCFEKVGLNDLKTIYNSSEETADRIIIRGAYHELFGIALYSVSQ